AQARRAVTDQVMDAIAAMSPQELAGVYHESPHPTPCPSRQSEVDVRRLGEPAIAVRALQRPDTCTERLRAQPAPQARGPNLLAGFGCGGAPSLSPPHRHL